MIYSVTFIIYMVCFGLCGLYYAIKLGRLIYTLRSYKLKKADFDAGKTVSQKQKALNKLRRVQRTVIVLTFMAILAIGFYGFRVFDIDVCCDPDQTYANFGYLIFISVVHVGECITLKQLLNTIKTVDYKKKKQFYSMGRDNHTEKSDQSSNRIHTNITDDMLLESDGNAVVSATNVIVTE